MLFPTSIILSFDPIYHVALSMFFKALWFCCLSERSQPNRLSEHSSRRSALHYTVIGISISSSLVRQRFWSPSTTTCSIEEKNMCWGGGGHPTMGSKISSRKERRKGLLPGQGGRDSYEEDNTLTRLLRWREHFNGSFLFFTKLPCHHRIRFKHTQPKIFIF